MAYDSTSRTHYSPSTKYNPSSGGSTTAPQTRNISGSNEYGNPNYNPGAGAKNIQYRDSSGQVHTGVYTPETGQTLAPGETMNRPRPTVQEITPSEQLESFGRDEGFSYGGRNYMGEAAARKLQQLKNQGTDLSQLGPLRFKPRQFTNTRAVAIGQSNLPFLQRYRQSLGQPNRVLSQREKDAALLKRISQPIGEKPKAPSSGGTFTTTGVRIPDAWLPKKTTTQTTRTLKAGMVPDSLNVPPTPGKYGYKVNVGGFGKVYEKQKTTQTAEVDMSDFDRAAGGFGKNRVPVLSDILEPLYRKGMGELRQAEYNKRLSLLQGSNKSEAEAKYRQEVKDITNPLNVKVKMEAPGEMRYSKSLGGEVIQRAANLDVPGIDVKLSTGAEAVATGAFMAAAPIEAAGFSYIGGKAFQASKSITPEGIPAASLVGGMAGVKMAGLGKSIAKQTLFPKNVATEVSSIRTHKLTDEWQSGQTKASTTLVKDIAQGEGRTLTALGKTPSPGKSMGGEIPIIMKATNRLGESELIEVRGSKAFIKSTETGLSRRMGAPVEVVTQPTKGTLQVEKHLGEGKTLGGRMPMARQDIVSSAWVKSGKKSELYGGRFRLQIGEKRGVGTSGRKASTGEMKLPMGLKIERFNLGKKGKPMGDSFKRYRSLGMGSVSKYGEKSLTKSPIEMNVGKTTRTRESMTSGIERLTAKFRGMTSTKSSRYTEKFRTKLGGGGGRDGRTREVSSGGGGRLKQVQDIRMEDLGAKTLSVTRQESALRVANKLKLEGGSFQVRGTLMSQTRQSPALMQMSRTTTAQTSRQLMKSSSLSGSRQESRTMTRLMNQPMQQQRQLQRLLQKTSTVNTPTEIPRTPIVPGLPGPPTIPGGLMAPGGGGGGAGSFKRGFSSRHWKVSNPVKTPKELSKLTYRKSLFKEKKKRRRG